MATKLKTQMQFNADNTIVGTFMLPDRSITHFHIDNNGNFEQWGNTIDNQKKTIKELTNIIQVFYTDI